MGKYKQFPSPHDGIFKKAMVILQKSMYYHTNPRKKLPS